MSEEVKRLTPLKNTLRELFLKSGNECAFPDCHNLMMNNNGEFIGQICHIEAAAEQGERFNRLQTNEDRRSFDNLMLMCYEHHTVTNNVEIYTVSILRRMKSTHESKFSDILTKMRDSIIDHTDVPLSNDDRTLIRFLSDDDGVLDLTEEQRLASIEEFNIYATKIQGLPIPTRQLLAAIINRANGDSGGSFRDCSTNYYETLLACDLDPQEMREHISIMVNAGVVYVDEIEGVDVIILQCLESGWPIASHLKDFCHKNGYSLTSILVDLDFALLD